MSLSAGTRLGPYEVVSRLGAGGMGEVWRARDTRLDRDVALKVIHPELAADADRISRFEREARAAARLDHPNVLVVHDVGTHEGSPYIVSELLEGESLRERLRAPLSPKAAVDIATQIVNGLAAAHERGIVHRDLKPENVFIKRDGRVKILDFGVAKLTQPSSESVGTSARTLTATEAGVLPGTAGYMSPEQVQGLPVDARSDLFSLGVVLYEMLAGQRPFQRGTTPETLTAILREAPRDLSEANPDVPPPLERVVRHCLEKDPARRFQSARDIVFALESLDEPGGRARVSGRGGAAAGSRTRWLVPLAAGGIALALLGVWAATRRTGRPSPTKSRAVLAVLPVENLSRDPEQDYFSDGLTEELIAQLGRLKPARLGVIARTSVVQFKKSGRPVDQIGRELGADYVLEGSVRREGARARITVQLVQARDQTQLWSESYERDLSSLFAIQSDVSEKVARSLAIELLPGEGTRTNADTSSAEAYDAYLRGRQHWNRRTAKELLAATEQFKAATQVDSAYARAWAGLADSYALYAHYGVLDARESFPLARAAAEKALALDPGLVEARTTLAFIAFYHDWDWADARRRLEQILTERPDYAVAHHWHAEFLSAMGEHEAALAEVRRAQALDPLSPLMKTIEAYVYFYAREFVKAADASEKALRIEPGYGIAHLWLSRAHMEMGLYDRARADLESAGGTLADSARSESPWMAYFYARSGDRTRALEILRTLEGRGGVSSSKAVAMAYAAIGRNDDAVRILENDFEERNVALVNLRVDPRYDPLRSDPRFQDLVRRMNFPNP